MFFTEAELTKKPAKASGVNPASLRRLEYVAPERAICRQPLELPFGDEVVFDTETYVNYNLVAFKHLPSQQYFYMEAPFNTHALSFALSRFKLISFNGIKYDMAILRAILRGDDCLAVKALSDRIIKENERITWDDHPFNHIDVIEVCPLKGSQKLYAARLHAERIQELPIDPDTVLTGEEKLVIKDYCFNDLDNLELIYNELRPHIALREDFGRLYKTDDLRSKSDAQLAEAVIRSELHRVTGKRPQRPPSAVGKVFCYSAPAYVQFRSSELTAALASIQQTPITVGLSGHVECPAEIEGRALVIAGNAYTIGMGGLHSNEKSQSAIGNLLDIDVTGYYPNLILGNRFYPAHLGEAFLTVFQGMVDRRTESKHKFPLATDPIIRKQLETEANGLKIANNGSFGKTSDPYSIINDPQMMVQTTLTGQLSLLMLIERLTLEGFVVLSANTDGIVVDRPPSRYNNLVGIVKQWEADTCLQTEETRYSAIYSRDVNAYFALKADGVKVKGSYSDKGSA
ncbi:MAG TPA: hypothetical protein VN081_04650, partial [Dongiaceae bacterium]|nr:hypothetical protein [Dongiaceae bacterium]